MLPLHDRTRRQIGVLAFVLLCLAPTALVVAYGITRHLPGHTAKEADRLRAVLRLNVALDDIEHLRPGVVRYEGLELADAETQRTVFRCRRLDAAWQTLAGEDGRLRPCLRITAVDPQLHDGSLAHVWRLTQDLLACRTGVAPFDVQFVADRLTLQRGERAEACTSVQASFTSAAEQAQAELSLHRESEHAAEPVRLQLVRTREATPVTGFAFTTGGPPLPCSILAMAMPEFDATGPRSRFQGILQANLTPGGWDGALQGQFHDVDLRHLLAGRLPHSLEGVARVVLDKARFRQGRLEQLSGSLATGPGEVGPSLLDAAARHLHLARNQNVPATQPLLPYERLELRFSLDARGLMIEGACPPAGSGVILVDRYGPLLAQAGWQPQPVAAMVQLLVPAGDPQVPATLQTESWLRRLPLPAASDQTSTVSEIRGVVDGGEGGAGTAVSER